MLNLFYTPVFLVEVRIQILRTSLTLSIETFNATMDITSSHWSIAS